MATREELFQALRNADKAGDAEGARKLAAYIQSMPADMPQDAKPADAPKGKGFIDSAIDFVKKDLSEAPAKAGNLIAGGIRGAGSIGSTLLAPYDMAKDALDGKGVSLESNRQRRADIDAGLQSMGADPSSTQYQVGKIGAEIAGTSGVGGVLGNVVRGVSSAPKVQALANAIETGGFRAGTQPGIGNMLTRILGGGINGAVTAGAIDPQNADTGAAIGASLPVAAALVGKGGRAVGDALSIGDRNAPLARLAVNKYSIPLGVGDMAEGGTLKALRSILNDAPISGGIGASQREAVQEGFNKAVGGTFGAPEAKLTAQVLDSAKSRMGAEFDRIWNNNQLQVDSGLVNRMMALQQQAAKLPKNEGASLNAEINDLFSKMAQDANGATVIPGDVANKFQSYLRRRVDGSTGLKNELGDLRQEIIAAFNRSVRPEDAAALTLNRTQYKAFKTVEPLLNSAEAGVAGRIPGDIPAGLLPQAVARQYSQAGNADLGELSQIGSRFLVDRTAKTGGSARAALQNVGIGSALTYGGLTNPLLAAAAIPAAAGTNALLGSPKIAKALLNASPQNRLSLLLQQPELAQFMLRSAPVLSDR